jgi:hypothetical protein
MELRVVDQITPFSIDIFKKLRISQLAENFYAIYGIRKSITVHECPTLDAILSQMNPLHALMTNLRAVSILSSFLGEYQININNYINDHLLSNYKVLHIPEHYSTPLEATLTFRNRASYI